MGLSTHVLDTMHGTPAAGMTVRLYTREGDTATLVRTEVLNADGRTSEPLYANNALKAGRYRLVFEVAAYFRGKGVQLPEPPFLEDVTLDFGVAEPSRHYHVPLLVTPWGHSTYRGS